MKQWNIMKLPWWFMIFLYSGWLIPFRLLSLDHFLDATVNLLSGCIWDISGSGTSWSGGSACKVVHLPVAHHRWHVVTLFGWWWWWWWWWRDKIFLLMSDTWWLLVEFWCWMRMIPSRWRCCLYMHQKLFGCRRLVQAHQSLLFGVPEM